MNSMTTIAKVAVDAKPINLFHPKITAEHLELAAVVYVRQSTGAQLREHQESTARQYAMKQRVMALGWSGAASESSRSQQARGKSVMLCQRFKRRIRQCEASKLRISTRVARLNHQC